MNKKFIFVLVILISFFSFNSYSQNVTKEIQTIDSLINSRLDFSKIDAFGKSNSSEIKRKQENINNKIKRIFLRKMYNARCKK